jgi:hypothetical protein
LKFRDVKLWVSPVFRARITNYEKCASGKKDIQCRGRNGIETESTGEKCKGPDRGKSSPDFGKLGLRFVADYFLDNRTAANSPTITTAARTASPVNVSGVIFSLLSLIG